MRLVEKAVKGVLGATGIGSLLGIESPAEKAAQSAAGLQAQAAGAGIEEQRRQFDITTEQLSDAEAFNRQQLTTGKRAAILELRGGEEKQFAQLDPFSQAAVGALEQQQALLGLGSPEEQQAAFNQFA